MAIVRTGKVSVYVIGTQFNDVMAFLQKKGVMELAGDSENMPERIMQRVDYDVTRTGEALEILEKYDFAKKRLFQGRHTASSEEYIMERRESRAISGVINEILLSKQKIDENSENILRIETKLKQLSEYLDMDFPMRKYETKYVETAVGSCRPLSGGQIDKMIEKYGIRLYYEEIGRTKQKLSVWCVYLKSDIASVNEFFREIEFRRPDFSLSHHTPARKTEILNEAKEELLKRNEELKEKIRTLAKNRRRLELYYDAAVIRRDRYRAAAKAQSTDKTFAITGYVPEKQVQEIIDEIETRFCAAAETEIPDKTENPPVAFENNAFVRPVEEITASYSMPSADDIDPNPIMAVFYYWFFGMMFSDAGYGLLMMIVCGTLGFSRLLDQEKRERFKMFFWCGISTTLWGIAYGSFFGDMVGTVSKTFGSGKLNFAPVLLDPVNQALQLLIIAVAFGLVHIMTALVIKFSVKWKSSRRDAVFDVGFWMMVIAGLAVFAIGMGIGNIAVKNIGAVIAALGTLGIILTGGREQKNPVMRFLRGIMSLYDITGYVGDLLSYSRLMALGLATGVIASVVNVLGSLGGNTPLGLIMFILVSVVGHAMNFAINMLGAYVHTNRLQYVEFYQKFYEGGGRKFKPFKIRTKYYEFADR